MSGTVAFTFCVVGFVLGVLFVVSVDIKDPGYELSM